MSEWIAEKKEDREHGSEIKQIRARESIEQGRGK